MVNDNELGISKVLQGVPKFPLEATVGNRQPMSPAGLGLPLNVNC